MENGDGRVRLLARGDGKTRPTSYDGGRQHPRDDVLGGGARRAALQHDGGGEGGVRGERPLLAYDLGEQGVRVNAISAGPLRTVAARSISGFGDMYSVAGKLSMLKRNITQDEVAGLALSLVADDLGSGITGETIYVDAGYHAMGMFLDAVD